MRRSLLAVLVTLNALFALALFATPARTQVVRTASLASCCKTTSGGQGYCCFGCCWFTANCHSDSQCGNE